MLPEPSKFLTVQPPQGDFAAAAETSGHADAIERLVARRTGAQTKSH